MSRYEEQWTERVERRLSNLIRAGEQRCTRTLLWLQCIITCLMISGCFDASLPEFRGDYGVIREEICGDRILTRSEQCDDGNTTNGDGCSSECFVHTPRPRSIEPTTSSVMNGTSRASSTELDPRSAPFRPARRMSRNRVIAQSSSFSARANVRVADQ